MVSGSISLRSQRYFSPFPHGTGSLSVANEYLALRRGRRRFMQRFTCAALLRDILGPHRISVTRISRSLSTLFHTLNLSLIVPHWSPTTPTPKTPVWAGPFSLAATYGIDSLSFPLVTEMFHFTGSRNSFPIVFRKERLISTPARLPHSEIPGSKVFARYPKLIAAYHVLHRLLAPRHPPYALNSLFQLFLKLKKASERAA